MGNSFVLFDVSMEMSLRQFLSGKIGHTQKAASPWARASYPRRGKMASATAHKRYQAGLCFGVCLLSIRLASLLI